MPSDNQTAGCLNQLFLQNKSIKQSHYLDADRNSQKFTKVVRKFFVWAWPKYGLANLVSGV